MHQNGDVHRNDSEYKYEDERSGGSVLYSLEVCGMCGVELFIGRVE